MSTVDTRHLTRVRELNRRLVALNAGLEVQVDLELFARETSASVLWALERIVDELEDLFEKGLPLAPGGRS